jgi:hypothetical protein
MPNHVRRCVTNYHMFPHKIHDHINICITINYKKVLKILYLLIGGTIQDTTLIHIIRIIKTIRSKIYGYD